MERRKVYSSVAVSILPAIDNGVVVVVAAAVVEEQVSIVLDGCFRRLKVWNGWQPKTIIIGGTFCIDNVVGVCRFSEKHTTSVRSHGKGRRLDGWNSRGFVHSGVDAIDVIHRNVVIVIVVLTVSETPEITVGGKF